MVKLRVTAVFEYEADPAHYGTDDPAKMAAIDRGNVDCGAIGFDDLICDANMTVFKVEAITP